MAGVTQVIFHRGNMMYLVSAMQPTTEESSAVWGDSGTGVSKVCTWELAKFVH